MDFAQHVKSSVDIVRVVGDYVRLTRRGADRYWGLCPFHSEKTPSFSVHSSLQIYKCFGCGKGGDVFTFLMEHQGLSFFEAVKMLAEEHGIPLPQRRDPEAADEAARLRDALLRMHEIAQRFFERQLASNAGVAVREYLASRGLDDDSAGKFGLGYAPASGLAALLKREGFSEDQVLQSGLVGWSSGRPGVYDFFRNRLTFPITNQRGKVIAFAGRALGEDQAAKYLNSPDTPIYVKKETLYHLDRAKEAMRRGNRVVLVEGYMDVIGAARAGVSEVVATCGTALTPEHVGVLRRLVDSVIVNFDSDQAGRDAAEKSIEKLLREDFEVRVLTLPQGKDPDEYCRQHGAEAYRALLDSAPSYFVWLSDQARRRFDLRSAEGRHAAFEFLKPSVSLVPDKIKRAGLAREMAEHLGVDAGLVLEEFRRAAIGRSSRPVPKTAAHPYGPGERILIELFLESAEAREEMLEETAQIAHAEALASHPVFEAMRAAAQPGEAFSFDAIRARLGERDREVLEGMVFADDRPPVTVAEGRQSYAALQRRSWERRYREAKREIAEAEKSGDRGRVIELFRERMDLERRLAARGPLGAGGLAAP